MINKLTPQNLYDFGELLLKRLVNTPIRSIIDEYLSKEFSEKSNDTSKECCKSCQFWGDDSNGLHEKEVCSKLSFTLSEEVSGLLSLSYRRKIPKDVNETGIISYPANEIHGEGFKYLTKPWFYCLHYKRK
jgi:hypothetical protein